LSIVDQECQAKVEMSSSKEERIEKALFDPPSSHHVRITLEAGNESLKYAEVLVFPDQGTKTFQGIGLMKSRRRGLARWLDIFISPSQEMQRKKGGGQAS
jgi:hypothetical protein